MTEAVDFRQAMARLYKEFTADGSWFFKPWNKEVVTDPQTGKTYDFADAPTKLLTTVQDCWVMHPGEAATASKIFRITGVCSTRLISILAPGMGEDGELEEPVFRRRWSLPGLVATALYLPAPLTSKLCSCSLWA